MWNRSKADAKVDRNLFDKPLDKLVERPAPAITPPPAPVPAPAVVPEARVPEPKADATARKPAAPAAPALKGSVLGASLRFKGDLVADEDLVVQGQIEGSILHSRSLTIGADGGMKGDIRARRIVVEGTVTGDLYALECVTVRATGKVRGSIYAPRVAIAEGAEFNGRVDMEHAPAVPAVGTPQVVALAAAAAEEPPSAAEPIAEVEVEEILKSEAG
jgi:cytoskeletal protein CcmA (bactofilin family)